MSGNRSQAHAKPVNYTTEIDALKTASEILARLGAHGATNVNMVFDAGRPRGIAFQVATAQGDRAFRLPVDVSAMESHLNRLWRAGDIAPRYASAEQAERVAWRVQKVWLDANLAMIEAGQTKLAQTLLPYMITDGGDTLWERFESSGLPALTDGSESEVHDAVVVAR